MSVPSVTFWNGFKMPLLGFGTFMRHLSDNHAKDAVVLALETGYRHFDTAFFYKNESAIGQVFNEWISSGRVKREDLFITTKLTYIGGNRPENVEYFLSTSLKRLGLDYVDLYLIHSPVAIEGNKEGQPTLNENGKVILMNDVDHVALWKSMEAQVDAGRTKSIGLSNFNSRQIERIVQNSRIKPVNLQVECHAYFQQKPLRLFCEKQGITVCAYGSLGSVGRVEQSAALGKPAPEIPKVLEDPVVTTIAQKYGKTPAQVLLRHLVQQNVVVIPKSTTLHRIQENFEIFDFVLRNEDMELLNGLDRNMRTTDFHLWPEVKAHPEYPYNIPF